MAWRPVAPLPVIQAPQYAYGQGGGAVSGSVVAGAPLAFSAYHSTTQSFATGDTKVSYDTEEYDYGGSYNTATSRFQPATPGVYLINAGVSFNSPFLAGRLAIWKNGAQVRVGGWSNANQINAVISNQVYLNGTTDYVEIYVGVASGTAPAVAASAGTYFQASLLTMPSAITFSAYKAANQSITTTSTNVAVLFDSEHFDIGGYFDTTNNRFLPLVAGYYQFGATMRTTAAVSATVWAGLQKNGGTGDNFRRGTQTPNPSWGVTATGVFYLNGSTDYVKATFWTNASVTLEGGTEVLTFYGHKLT